MSPTKAFRRLVIKPLAADPFSNAKIPFIHTSNQVFSKENPLWTAIAAVASLAVGLAAFAVFSPLVAAIATPFVTTALFALSMFTFDAAQVGPFTSKRDRAQSYARQGADTLASETYDFRRTFGLTSKKEDRRAELNEAAQELTEDALGLVDEAKGSCCSFLNYFKSCKPAMAADAPAAARSAARDTSASDAVRAKYKKDI